MPKSTSIALPAGKRWNEVDARAVFDALAASGLSLSAFARLKGLSPERLYKRRFRADFIATPA